MSGSIKKAYICNLVIAFTELFAVAWMFSGILVGHGQVTFTSARWGMLKYYTVDSNILMGIVAALSAHAQKAVLDGKQQTVPPALCGMKLAGVVGVTLTMLVTVFFLAPTSQYGWLSLFTNSNLFLHLLLPLASLFGFLVYERGSVSRRRDSLLGIASVVIYGVCYAVNCALHTVDNVVPRQYDWYGFAAGGLRSGCLVALPLLLLISYAVSFLLWRMNRR